MCPAVSAGTNSFSGERKFEREHGVGIPRCAGFGKKVLSNHGILRLPRGVSRIFNSKILPDSEAEQYGQHDDRSSTASAFLSTGGINLPSARVEERPPVPVYIDYRIVSRPVPIVGLPQRGDGCGQPVGVPERAALPPGSGSLFHLVFAEQGRGPFCDSGIQRLPGGQQRFMDDPDAAATQPVAGCRKQAFVYEDLKSCPQFVRQIIKINTSAGTSTGLVQSGQLGHAGQDFLFAQSAFLHRFLEDGVRMPGQRSLHTAQFLIPFR
jgi:hypothetical protein